MSLHGCFLLAVVLTWRTCFQDVERLLHSQTGRLSGDTRRVVNQISKKSVELIEESQYAFSSNVRPILSWQAATLLNLTVSPPKIQRRIWEKNDFEEFEKNRNQEAQVTHYGQTDMPMQQAARAASFQGWNVDYKYKGDTLTSFLRLTPPPRVALKSGQAEVQEPVEM